MSPHPYLKALGVLLSPSQTRQEHPSGPSLNLRLSHHSPASRETSHTAALDDASHLAATNVRPPTPPSLTPADGETRFEPITLPCEWVEDYCPGGHHPVVLGDVFHDGQFKVIRKLGEGSYSTVWLARDSKYAPSLLLPPPLML